MKGLTSPLYWGRNDCTKESSNMDRYLKYLDNYKKDPKEYVMGLPRPQEFDLETLKHFELLQTLFM